MRLSLLISILVHVILLFALVYMFNVVPDMRLPKKIYSVKILQPIIRKAEPEPEVKTEVKKEAPAPAKPKPKKKDEPKKKVEEKKPPEPVKEEKPLDVSVDKVDEATSSMTVDAPRFPFSYYLSAIERKVSQNWFSSASERGTGISCVVYFRMNRNGSVADVRIEESSGNSYFDRSALRAIKSSAPFPPLPRAFTEPWLGIHFTFIQKD
ncbi:MAG: TonB C-terminal domain-containing protein [Candidatus Krumholzibacteriota bacterium]|nr:TonB C-terminal domain-containing protein [Candidatus Krumholzibacteriota bacterium]